MWIAAALALSPIALAGSPDTPVVRPPPPRVYRLSPDRQYHLRKGEDWTSLRSGALKGWSVRFDERTGRPWKAWGAGIPLGPLSDASAVDAALRRLMAQHPELAGVPEEALALGAAVHRPERDAWLVRYDQVLPSSPHPEDPDLRGELNGFEHLISHGQTTVWRGSVQLSILKGRLTQVSIQTYPGAALAEVRVSARQAVATSVAATGLTRDKLLVEGAALVVIPEEAPGGMVYRTAWLVRTRTGEATASAVRHFIDATTGERFAHDDESDFISGTLHAEYDVRPLGEGLQVAPMVGIRVNGSGGDHDYTDSTGTYSVTGEATAVLYHHYDGILRWGEWEDGSERVLSGSTEVWAAPDVLPSELTASMSLAEARAWMNRYDPTHRLTDNLMQVVVNYAGSSGECHSQATYDVDVGPFTIFLSAEGETCSDLGRIKDVLFHEWGHGILKAPSYRRYRRGPFAEGYADFFVLLQTGDPNIAPGFYLDGSPLRDLEPDLRYPDDLQGDRHHDGLVFSGAMWDLYKALAARDGASAAIDHLSRIAVEIAQPSLGLADTYDAVVFADDDDGDLSNGTPNFCEIADAFGAHGLGPAGHGPSLYLGHDSIVNQPSEATSYRVEAELVDGMALCNEAVETVSASVYWSVDGGENYTETPLDITGTLLSADIPAVPTGSIVTYYVEAYADDTRVLSPTNGASSPASFAVGELIELYCTDFESDDESWTATGETAEQWTCEEPRGFSGDPSGAFSGSMACGTNKGDEDVYMPSSDTQFVSPPLSVRDHTSLILQYRRWLNVEDGNHDQATISMNDTEIWRNPSSQRGERELVDPIWRRTPTTDRQWVLHTLPFTVERPVLRVAFGLKSDEEAQRGGWTIDDVCIYGVAIEAEDTGDGSSPPSDSGIDHDSGVDGSPSPDKEGHGDDKSSGGCVHGVNAGSSAMLVSLVLGMAAALRRRETDQDKNR